LIKWFSKLILIYVYYIFFNLVLSLFIYLFIYYYYSLILLIVYLSIYLFLTFSNSRLPHPRLPNQHRVVLGAAREHLNHTPDDVIAADDLGSEGGREGGREGRREGEGVDENGSNDAREQTKRRSPSAAARSWE